MAQGKELLNIALLNAALDMSEGRGLGESIGRTAQGLNLVGQFEQQQTGTQLDNAKKMLELQKLQQEISQGEGMLDLPEKEYSAEQQALDATIPESFGVYDQAIDTPIAAALSYFNLGPAGGFESQVALQARSDLNQAIKVVMTEGYKGKPSNYLLQFIEELLPSGMTGDPTAAAKYRVLQQQFVSREKALTEEIKLAKPNSKTLIDLVQQRANVVQINKRISNVLNAFGSKPGAQSRQADGFYTAPGIEPGTILPSDEESLDLLVNDFMSLTEEPE
jgi:hypothetical protein